MRHTDASAYGSKMDDEMIIGSYPCCDHPLMISVPDKTPSYFSEECPKCGATVWHKLSRIDPTSWLESDFLETHDIDYENRTIVSRDAK